MIEAADGEEAVDIFFNQKDISLILLDVMMPRMDGWEVDVYKRQGMYNVGKSIGHVSTDGGISASRYLELTRKNKSSTKASEAVESAISAADAETSEEVSTDENGTDEHGTDVNLSLIHI